MRSDAAGVGANVHQSLAPRQEIVARLTEREIDQVQVIFLDYNGIPRARSVAIGALAAAISRGINFSSPTVDFNSRDLFPSDAAFDLASPDVWARPDPATLVIVPWLERTGAMLADLVTATGDRWQGCPRGALRAAVERLASAGFTANVGFEPEGYVFRDHVREVAPVGSPGFATLDGLDLESGFMTELLRSLEAIDLDVEQWSEEYGPGQIEVNMRFLPAVEAADGLVRYKHVFRSVAGRHGLLGTFMPKPFADQAGSGLHVHLSLSPIDIPGENALDGEADRSLGLSALGRFALGGLLAHGEAHTALGASTVNSYKRFIPSSWAPTHVMYAYASRAAFIRIPERETARRLELRAGDPACNPYLYLTAILAAVIDGIQRELDPGPPLPGNVGSLADKCLPEGVRPLPRDLGAALDALERDSVLREALGPVILDEFVKVKRSEWDDFCRHVGQWDRDWYLRRY